MYSDNNNNNNNNNNNKLRESEPLERVILRKDLSKEDREACKKKLLTEQL